MSYGVPGRDFGDTELVTAQALRQWLENATWRAIGSSEVTNFLGILTAITAPTNVSEGTLWWSPIHQVLSICTVFGWWPVYYPAGHFLGRFRTSASGGPFASDPTWFGYNCDVWVAATNPSSPPAVAAPGDNPIGGSVWRKRCEVGMVSDGTAEATLPTKCIFPLLRWGAVVLHTLSTLPYPVARGVVTQHDGYHVFTYTFGPWGTETTLGTGWNRFGHRGFFGEPYLEGGVTLTPYYYYPAAGGNIQLA